MRDTDDDPTWIQPFGRIAYISRRNLNKACFLLLPGIFARCGMSLLLLYAFRKVLIREDQMNSFLLTASILVSGSILVLAYKLWPK